MPIYTCCKRCGDHKQNHANELCQSCYRREYYKKNKEKIKRDQRKRYKENREKKRAYNKRYYQENKTSLNRRFITLDKSFHALSVLSIPGASS